MIQGRMDHPTCMALYAPIFLPQHTHQECAIPVPSLPHSIPQITDVVLCTFAKKTGNFWQSAARVERSPNRPVSFLSPQTEVSDLALISTLTWVILQ